MRFTSNETSINLVSFIILIHFITNKEKRVDKSTQHVHRQSDYCGKHNKINTMSQYNTLNINYFSICHIGKFIKYD